MNFLRDNLRDKNMSRVRRAPKQLKSSVKIHILCEGETEEAHLGKILSSYRNVSIA